MPCLNQVFSRPRNVVLAAAFAAPPEQWFDMYLDARTYSAFTGKPVTNEPLAGAEFRAFDLSLGAAAGRLINPVEPRFTWFSKRFCELLPRRDHGPQPPAAGLTPPPGGNFCLKAKRMSCVARANPRTLAQSRYTNTSRPSPTTSQNTTRASSSVDPPRSNS
jgi:hypothetical protein